MRTGLQMVEVGRNWSDPPTLTVVGPKFVFQVLFRQKKKICRKISMNFGFETSSLNRVWDLNRV